jgi:hypothetical protein
MRKIFAFLAILRKIALLLEMQQQKQYCQLYITARPILQIEAIFELLHAELKLFFR